MHQSDKTRREFLSRVAGLVGPLATGAAAIAKGAIANNDGDDGRLKGPADVSLRIAPVQVHTVGYNGTAPGPLIRFREGVTSTGDLFNDTATPEFVHWHLRNS